MVIDGQHHGMLVDTADVTTLRAAVWPAGDAGPAQSRVSFDAGTPARQDLPGGFAADIYNCRGTGSVYVDDVFIAAM